MKWIRYTVKNWISWEKFLLKLNIQINVWMKMGRITITYLNYVEFKKVIQNIFKLISDCDLKNIFNYYQWVLFMYHDLIVDLSGVYRSVWILKLIWFEINQFNKNHPQTIKRPIYSVQIIVSQNRYFFQFIIFLCIVVNTKFLFAFSNKQI